MDSSGGATASNWSETVEDLVHDGEIARAISFLESRVLNLEKEMLEKEKLQNDDDVDNSCCSIADHLSTALQDLSKLYSAQGLSLRAEETLSRALEIKIRKGALPGTKESISDGVSERVVSESGGTTSDVVAEHGCGENFPNTQNDGCTAESSSDDDWEAIVDRAPEELLPAQSLPGVSNLSLEDSKGPEIKKRGRGTFSYKKQGLHSDNMADEPVDEPVVDDTESNSPGHAENLEEGNLCGTRHALVLADFPPSTRTTDLEKVLEKFKNRFVIRWVNDTVALAVFRTPSVALEARNSIQFPFAVRILDEDDELLSSIPPRDLEPPRQRPQTSARTAQRLIAQGIGIKLPTTFGSTELRKQEEARRNRIVSRQAMKDDAWGGDADKKA